MRSLFIRSKCLSGASPTCAGTYHLFTAYGSRRACPQKQGVAIALLCPCAIVVQHKLIWPLVCSLFPFVSHDAFQLVEYLGKLRCRVGHKWLSQSLISLRVGSLPEFPYFSPYISSAALSTFSSSLVSAPVQSLYAASSDILFTNTQCRAADLKIAGDQAGRGSWCGYIL